MKVRPVLLAALMAPMLLANPAHAAKSSASASVSISEIVLTDTDLNDGIAPSLQVLPNGFFSERGRRVLPRSWRCYRR